MTAMTDDDELARIARGLTANQRALLADICGCPGLHAGQYKQDGAGIEHLPRELWWQSYSGGGAILGLGKVHPSDLGLALRTYLENHDDR